MYGILHAHSEFSTRDSLIRVEDLPKAAKEHGWGACALTDHGGIEGIYHFKKAAKEVGIKAIAGVELYIKCADLDKAHHLTVLAKNANGFSSICKTLSYAHANHYNGRRRRADVPIEYALENLKDVVILSGCFSSPFWRGTPQAAEDLRLFVEKFGGDFYFECQGLFDWIEQVKLNATIMSMALKYNRPLVVTPDCHFTTPEESQFHEALLAVASGIPIQDPKAWKFSTHLNYIQSPAQSMEGLVQAGMPRDMAKQAIETTIKVAESVKDWDWNDLPAPRLPDVGGNMRELAMAGLAARGLDAKTEYQERMSEELKCFSEAGLDRYLLLVRHCLNLFRKEGAEIGPRGSVGGSLVAYCLGINTLDPIEHNLLWQRFYFPGRKGWPDVDVDVDTDFRERLPEVLRKEFGEDRVAQISNFGTFGLRQAIRDAARAYGVRLDTDISEIEMREILQAHDNDEAKIEIDELRTWQELSRKNPDAGGFAHRLRNRIRQFGAHAGGFVITADPVTEGRACVVRRGKDKALVWDMEVTEKLGFVKFDFLGLDALSAIKRVSNHIQIDWNSIPLKEDNVYRDLSEGRTAGVPQFLTSGLRMFLEALKPTKFLDLVWAVAAFRPGALGQFSPRELASKYRKDPDSIIVFQEDIMAICVNLAGFSWSEADLVRKVVAKKEGKVEWAKWTEKFASGCEKHGTLPRQEAVNLWQSLEEFARYSFNAAHAASYSWNAFRIAWAKRHHPTAMFSALLNSNEKHIEPLKDEAPAFGVKILPPDVNCSGLEWTMEGDAVRAPLTDVSGVDLRIAKLILRFRANGRFQDEADFKKRMDGYKFPDRIVEPLFGKRLSSANPLFMPDQAAVEAHNEKVLGCSQCPLGTFSCGRYSPIVGMKRGKTNVMIVGESPGWDEVKNKTPFVGRSGFMIDTLLFENGVAREDLTVTNACKCRPPYPKPGEEAKISRHEVEDHMDNCPWVLEEIRMFKPPLILAVGKHAWKRLGGEGGITKANGTVIEKDNSIIVASVHPAFVMRDNSMKPEIERAFRKFASIYKDIVPESVRSKPVPPKPPEERVSTHQLMGRAFGRRNSH